MSWLNLNQSLNSLKGQITNFASEVLSEVPGQDAVDNAAGTDTSYKELEEKCRKQELEIASLKRLTTELEATLESERLNQKNGVKEDESSWYWDPTPQPPRTDDIEVVYKTQIKTLQEEISTLKERYNIDPRQDSDCELEKLREENKNLTTNLEDLDSQHQLAMERLLSLKQELQRNFEVLRQEHEELKYNNDEYGSEIKNLLAKVGEKDRELKSLQTAQTDYDTLHHKYINLERVHGLLRENAEKFQEENQDLHEEVFKLQEHVTKLEHQLEVAKHTELSDTVPRDKYDELLKELNDLKDSRNSNHRHIDEINIDDNAKSVIENLKRELHDVKHKLLQKGSDGTMDNKAIQSEKIMQFYNKYVDFDLPVDYLGEIPSSGENVVMFKLESVFKTLHSFKKDIDSLNHKLSEKKSNMDNMQKQIDYFTTENDFLTNDLHHLEKELEEMKKNNDFLIAEIAALKNTSKLEPIIETHEENLEKLETELKDSNLLNKIFESKINQIQKELESVNTEKASLQSSLADLKEKYTMMLSELDMFKTQTTAVAELEKTANIASEEMVKNCTQEIHELKKRLIAANAKNEQLSIDVHIVENDKVLLTQEIENLKAKINQTYESSMEKKMIKDDHEEKQENIHDENKSTSQELRKPVKIVAEKQLEIMNNENSILKESVTQLNSAIDHIRQKEQTLLNHIDDLTNARRIGVENEKLLQETIKELKDKLDDQEFIIKEYEMTASKNMSKNESGDVINSVLQELETIKSKKLEAENQLEVIKNENHLLKESVNQLNMTIGNIKQKERDLLNQIDVLTNARPTVIDNEKLLQETNKELKDKVENQEIIIKEFAETTIKNMSKKKADDENNSILQELKGMKSEKLAAEKQLEVIKNENSILKENISKLKTEIDLIRQNEQNLLNQTGELTNARQSVVDNEILLQETIKKFKEQIENQEIVIKEFEEITSKNMSIKEANLVNSTILQELKEIKLEKFKAEQQLDAIRNENSILKENVSKLNSEIDVIRQKEQHLLNEIDKLTHARQTVIDNEKLLQGTIKELKDKLKNQEMIIKELGETMSKNTIKKEADDKNVNIFLELKEIKSKKLEAEQQVEVIKKENRILKESVSQLNTAIDHIKQEERKLLKKIDDLTIARQTAIDNEKWIQGNKELNDQMRQKEQTLLSHIDDLTNARRIAIENEKLLQETIKELNVKLENHELIIKEIERLKNENIHLTQQKLQLETELTSTDGKIVQLGEDLDKLISNITEKDNLIDVLNATINENNSKISNLNEIIFELQNSFHIKNDEIMNLQKSVAELNQTTQQYDQTQKAILHENEVVNQKLLELNVEVVSKTEQISKLNNTIEELQRNCSHLKTLADEKDKEIKELRQSMLECSDKLKNVDHTTNAEDYAILLKEKEAVQNKLKDLQNNIYLKQEEFNEIKEKYTQMEKSAIEYKNLVDNITAEKTELINLVNLKHNESLQYHTEIQRLNHVLLEQNNEIKKIIHERNQQAQNNESCPVCDNLRMTLREKDEIIKTLNQSNSAFDKNKADLLNASEIMRTLTEKCDGLEKNLEIQLENVKKLAAEKIQVSEQHENATRELERLRHHLVEMEDNYTQELMTSEQKLTECQARLQHVEERAKQSSTVYTSNSIRANQEVETLRNQIRLLEKQREEVQARLGEAEDARSRSEAALTNLQVVLEQFQLDKERDIQTATEKIRNKMEDLKRENAGLQTEIENLNMKLQESLAGLQAATRLGDQLETKSAQINDLKEQVKTLQTSVGAAEERYYNAISNQQDKVDKNLVKNLVLNYVLTAGNSTNKTQILRVLSTVLDCNQQECRKLGLEKTPTDSLAAEFVKFLQDESKPRAPLPSMLGLARSTAPSSRKSSTTGPSPIPTDLGHKRNPSTGSNNLLFQHIDAAEAAAQPTLEADHAHRQHMDTGVNQTRNTEGAILKHVLKDMH